MSKTLSPFFFSTNHISFFSNDSTGQNKKHGAEQLIAALTSPEGRMPELLLFRGWMVQPKGVFFPFTFEKRKVYFPQEKRKMNRIFVRKTILYRFLFTEAISSWGLGFCKKP